MNEATTNMHMDNHGGGRGIFQSLDSCSDLCLSCLQGISWKEVRATYGEMILSGYNFSFRSSFSRCIIFRTRHESCFFPPESFRPNEMVIKKMFFSRVHSPWLVAFNAGLSSSLVLSLSLFQMQSSISFSFLSTGFRSLILGPLVHLKSKKEVLEKEAVRRMDIEEQGAKFLPKPLSLFLSLEDWREREK